MNEFDDYYAGDYYDFGPNADVDLNAYIEGEVVHETEKAVLFRIEGTEHWFPKTQIVHSGKDDDVDWMYVTHWIMEKKGLQEDDGDIPF